MVKYLLHTFLNDLLNPKSPFTECEHCDGLENGHMCSDSGDCYENQCRCDEMFSGKSCQLGRMYLLQLNLGYMLTYCVCRVESQNLGFLVFPQKHHTKQW